MKLDRYQLQFIDTYLKNSGVRYLDIRYEMIDHVASALEEQGGSFEDNFKHYMLENKKELLSSNRHFSKMAARKAIRIIMSSLAGLRFWLVAGILGCIILSAVQFTALETVTEILSGGQTLAMIALVIYYKYSNGHQNLEFSIIDKVFWTAILLTYLVILFIRNDNWFHSPMILLGFHTIFSAFFIEMIITFRTLGAKYKLQYGN